MGLFSFGKKDGATGRRGANTSSAMNARKERPERRTRRSEQSVDVDAMMLDPTLPEKQRARRRLVGAIALVIAAVVVLPMVLDSHPKPVTDDISIDIPSRPSHAAQSASVEDMQAGVAPDNPPATAAASGVASLSPSTSAAPEKEVTGRVTPQPTQANSKSPAMGDDGDDARTDQSAQQAANLPATAPSSKKPAGTPPQTTAGTAVVKPPQTAAAKPQQTATAKPQTSTTQQAPKAAATASPADAISGTPAAPPGARFAVQLGTFADDAAARNWMAKLKAAGVPAYTERRKEADGSTHTQLRAGPFADRAAAAAAIAKVREAGFTANATGNAARSGSAE